MAAYACLCPASALPLCPRPFFWLHPQVLALPPEKPPPHMPPDSGLGHLRGQPVHLLLCCCQAPALFQTHCGPKAAPNHCQSKLPLCCLPLLSCSSPGASPLKTVPCSRQSHLMNCQRSTLSSLWRCVGGKLPGLGVGGAVEQPAGDAAIRHVPLSQRSLPHVFFNATRGLEAQHQYLQTRPVRLRNPRQLRCAALRCAHWVRMIHLVRHVVESAPFRGISAREERTGLVCPRR